jgi:hypothetical protein
MFQAAGTDGIRLYRLPDQTQEMALYATKEFAEMVAAYATEEFGVPVYLKTVDDPDQLATILIGLKTRMGVSHLIIRHPLRRDAIIPIDRAIVSFQTPGL